MAEIITNKFQSKGGELVYHKIVGQNKDLTIIYIHGLTPISPLFIEMFIEQYHKFSLSDYSFIIPNLIGFGDSEKPENLDIYTMENQGQYLFDLLLIEKVHNLIIIAMSMGGLVAISLINKIKNLGNDKIRIKGLFYLEGNLDKNDTFFSSKIAEYPFEQFQEEFDSWIDKFIERSKSKNLDFWEGFRKMGPYSIWGSAYDIVVLSESNLLLPQLQRLSDFPMYFVFGEKNRGRFTSESLVKNANLPVIYIPNAGHSMRQDNPEGFWKIIKDLLKICL